MYNIQTKSDKQHTNYLLSIYQDMDVPRTLRNVPINIHKTAHITPNNEKQKNPALNLLKLLEVAEALPPVTTFIFLALILTLLKLDILSKARFTRAVSEAEAGVVGIDSTNDQRLDENQEPEPSSCLTVSF